MVAVLAACVGLVALRADSVPTGMASTAKIEGETPDGGETPDQPKTYAQQVHLGDSYAAGAGVTPLVDDSPYACQRSARNFGELVAQRRDWRLSDVSCSGAKSADLFRAQYYGVPAQLDALGPSVKVVTVALGGNDSNVFTSVVSECTRMGKKEPRGRPCRNALRTKLISALENRTLPDLTNALAEVHKRAPNAKVLVVGYPWIMPARGGCFSKVSIASGDVPFVHDLQRRLNDVVKRAADTTGSTFIDMSKRSKGHDACATPRKRWVEPMIDGPGSMHPNDSGQRAMANAVLDALY